MMSVAVYPVEIIQTPEAGDHHLGSFQRSAPGLSGPAADAKSTTSPPGYYGRSVGHWEGDTLVVDTIGIKTSVRYQGMPHSDQMRITERMRLVAPDFCTIRSPSRIR